MLAPREHDERPVGQIVLSERRHHDHVHAAVLRRELKVSSGLFTLGDYRTSMTTYSDPLWPRIETPLYRERQDVDGSAKKDECVITKCGARVKSRSA